MSKEDKNPLENENNDNLDFQDAKEMTVGEAVRKDGELKAGITEEDGVLDRYIKQHRDEVASRKFETNSEDFQNIDTSTLDNFIKQQRKELEDTGLIEPIKEADEETVREEAEAAEAKDEDNLEDTLIAPAVSPNQEIWKKAEFEDVALSDENNQSDGEEKHWSDSLIPQYEEDDDDFDDFKEDEEEKPFYKKKKVIITSLIILLLLAGGAAYGVYRLTHQETKTAKTTTSSTSDNNDKTNSIADSRKAFEKSYTAFFIDSKRTKLKNNQFANLPKLEKMLTSLKGSKYHDEAKKKYDSLQRQIAAINAVNGKFKENAVVDGQKKAVTIKDNANFDDISDKTLNTGNATLDTLLKSVIADGRKQLKSKKQLMTQLNLRQLKRIIMQSPQEIQRLIQALPTTQDHRLMVIRRKQHLLLRNLLIMAVHLLLGLLAMAFLIIKLQNSSAIAAVFLLIMLK